MALILTFAKTGAALSPVTTATSRELIALTVAMVGRPECSDETYVSIARQRHLTRTARDHVRLRAVRNDGASRRLP